VTTSPPPRRGRPRSEQARQAILQAAAQLLAERDFSDITMCDLAARAGTSKATIYRWWDSREAVVLDAYVQGLANVPVRIPETGSLRGDLLALLRARVRRWRAEPALGRSQVHLLAQIQSDPALRATYVDQVVSVLRQPARAVIKAAVERGEVPAEVDVETVLDMLYGPLYHRLFHRHAALDEEFVESLVDLLVAGVTRPRPVAVTGTHFH
jgi:AcrR family transcriptional regulator